MYVETFRNPAFSHLSYLIGCPTTREAVVVDPLRDVAPYLDVAQRDGLHITAVVETHLHSDVCSGARDLARQADARLFVSGCGGPKYAYTNVADLGAKALVERDVVDVGQVRLTTVHAPGPTPEHLNFLVTNRATGKTPVGMLVGDLLHVGDVGRPDLSAAPAWTPADRDSQGRLLYGSLRRMASLPDYLLIWPSHVRSGRRAAGLGTMPYSTLGYERRTNWAFREQTEAEFVNTLFSADHQMLRYAPIVAEFNRDGLPTRGSLPPIPHRSGVEAQRWQLKGGFVVDARSPAAFASAHLHGSLNIPMGPGFATWFASLVNYGTDVWLLVPDEARVEALVRQLQMLAFDRIVGVTIASDALLGVDALEVSLRSPVALAGSISRREVTLVDVRSRAEWSAGHIGGALNVPLVELPERLMDLPVDATLVTVSTTDTRASIAASILQLAGAPSLARLNGGIQAWSNAGLELATR